MSRENLYFSNFDFKGDIFHLNHWHSRISNIIFSPLTFATLLQGDPKKMIHSVLQLKSVVKVGFNFSTGVSESEF